MRRCSFVVFTAMQDHVASTKATYERRVIKTARRRVRLKGRKKVIGIKSNNRCWYCGNPFYGTKATKDHQLPKSRGGLGMPNNLVLACLRCNLEKADMDVETYRWFLREQRAAGETVIFYGERIPQPWWL